MAETLFRETELLKGFEGGASFLRRWVSWLIFILRLVEFGETYEIIERYPWVCL